MIIFNRSGAEAAHRSCSFAHLRREPQKLSDFPWSDDEGAHGAGADASPVAVAAPRHSSLRSPAAPLPGSPHAHPPSNPPF
jgi:hypothetical protein